MLDSRYSYYGNEIRFKTNQNSVRNIKVEWDGGSFTDYLTNTFNGNSNDLDTVIFDLPTEIQFKLLGELIKTDPYLAFSIIFKYNFKTFFGLTSALFSVFAFFIVCQAFITIGSNFLR